MKSLSSSKSHIESKETLDSWFRFLEDLSFERYIFFVDSATRNGERFVESSSSLPPLP
jgi:hypothetical protein